MDRTSAIGLLRTGRFRASSLPIANVALWWVADRPLLAFEGFAVSQIAASYRHS